MTDEHRDELIQELVRIYPLIQTWCKRAFVGAVADDLVQDIMVVALEKIRNGNFREESSLQTWVIGIYKNKRSSLIRRRNVDVARLNVDASSIAVEAASAVDAEEDARQSLLLERVLGCLSPLQRTVFRLKCEGFSSADIAEKTGRSRNCIDHQYAKAKSMLRIALVGNFENR